MHFESLRRIEAAGFHYKSPESPDLWTHLESHFLSAPHVGPRFGLFSDARMSEIIRAGEDVLLDALAGRLSHTGTLSRVSEVIEMPFMVGTSGVTALADVDPSSVLRLIDHAGTSRERIIHVLKVEAQAIPATHHMTVTGGLYADGHTTGYFDLYPGSAAVHDRSVFLATEEDIRSVLQDMTSNAEDIRIVTPAEAQEMVARSLELLR